MSNQIQFERLRVGYCTHLEWISRMGSTWKTVQSPAYCGLIFHPKLSYLLYDTGYSSHFFDATQSFPESLYHIATPVQIPFKENLLFQLKERNICPLDISFILISHFHADHVAGLKDFPNARFICTKKEYLSMREKSSIEQLSKGFLMDLIPDDFEDRVDFISDGQKIKLPSTLHPFTEGYDIFGDQTLLGVDLPGHCKSQLGLYLVDQTHKSYFLVGDACWSVLSLKQNQKPALIAQSIFANSSEYANTFKKLIQVMSNPNSPQILPTHDDSYLTN